MTVNLIEKARSATNRGITYAMGHGGEFPDDVLPTRDNQCDCSAFACWLVGVGKSPNKNPVKVWLGTGGIYTDAMTKNVLFERIPQPVPGCFAVYPAVPGKAGHIALVVDPVAKTIIDCSSSQNGIKEHSGAYFWTHSGTIWVKAKTVGDKGGAA